nr:SDR family NAD(P)-dependent oxidoreductase [uncultured Draconibacterium sp.]
MVLQNNTVLITGGSSGVGLELSKKIIAKNNKVLICSRSKEKLEKAKSIHPDINIFQCDISKTTECENLTNWIQEKHPECNILINNAAIVHISDFYTDIKILEKANSEIQTNLLAPIFLSKLLIPILEKNANPKLINITSGLAYVPKVDYPFYNATKAALHSFTQVLRAQMQKSTISIIEVFLPPVDTPFHKDNPNPPQKAISAEKAVSEMINGIEKEKREIRVGITKLLYLMARLTPKFAFQKVING